MAERVEIRNMNVADTETPGPIEGLRPAADDDYGCAPKNKPMSDLAERLKAIPGVTAVKIE